MNDFQCRLRALRADESGLQLIEFAFALPLLLAMGLGGVEVANFAAANLRVSQIALLTADNAGRVRSSIDETDINQALAGAEKIGNSLNIGTNGRIILSDLEMRTDGTGQWIRWQRCIGVKNVTSSYGVPRTSAGTAITNATEATAPSDQTKSVPTDGTNNTPTTGMGPPGFQVATSSGTAVMFVEVVYDYQPIVSNKWIGTRVIRYTGAYNVRQRTNQVPTNYNGVTPSKCSTFAA